MLKRMDTSLVRRCLADAARSPLSNPVVRYPGWYLQRWHFLPEGYLSRRSAAGYDALIRRIYNGAQEERVLGALVDAVASRLPESVLELGCGPGRGLAALRRKLASSRLTGLDLSPFMLERAAERLERAEPRVALVHGSGVQVELPAGQFDAVVACHFFGHLPRAAAQGAWEEAARLLAARGRLYVVDHAWHPRFATSLDCVSEQRLLAGLVTFRVYEKPRRRFANGLTTRVAFGVEDHDDVAPGAVR